MSAIQRSDQNLWPFLAVIPVWCDKTSSSTSRDSIVTTRKTASGNYVNYERDPTVESKLVALLSCYYGLVRQYLLFNE
jgi:hypothetical protein